MFTCYSNVCQQRRDATGRLCQADCDVFTLRCMLAGNGDEACTCCGLKLYNVNQEDALGNTPLYYCLWASHSEYLKTPSNKLVPWRFIEPMILLIEHGAHYTEVMSGGKVVTCPLVCAARAMHPDAIDLCARQVGADVNVVVNNADRPFVIVARNIEYELRPEYEIRDYEPDPCVAALLRHGADAEDAIALLGNFGLDSEYLIPTLRVMFESVLNKPNSATPLSYLTPSGNCAKKSSPKDTGIVLASWDETAEGGRGGCGQGCRAEG